MDEKSSRRLSVEDVAMIQEEHLSCPVCTISLTEPVYQCKNGHIICKLCLNELPKPVVCPNCSCNMSDPTRCRAIEQLLEVISLACELKKI